MATTTQPDWADIQARTLKTLFASAIAARAAMSVGFTVAALAIKEMLDSSIWAGLATVAITVGTALSASWLSNYMAAKGRNPGLRLGYLFAFVGAGITAVGVERQQIVIFLGGLVLFGVGQGGTNLARYAAADLATTAHRGRAISSVVFASTIGAVGGPLLVGPSSTLAENRGWNEFTGPFLVSAICFGVAGLVIWILLRPDPLVVNGVLSDKRTPPGTVVAGPPPRRSFVSSMTNIWAIPPARLALLSLIVSQMVMVMVMTMTPLHMDAHDHPKGDIGWVISIHTAGMFAFAPFAGRVSDKQGRVTTIMIGAGVLTAATILAALAVDAPNLLMFPALFLLGLGWSFGIVAGSALLTESMPDGEKLGAQGAADLATAIASGSGALASGFVFDMAGFHILSIIGTLSAGALIVVSLMAYRFGGPSSRLPSSA